MYEIKLLRVNGYRINEIKNIGYLEWLKIRIKKWLIGLFKKKIIKGVENVLENDLRSSLSRFDCGEYIPSFKILE
jgi:hypothetical protein